MVKDKRYNVAFRYTAEAKGYEGVVTWTSFGSKPEFDEWYTSQIRARQEVVEEGVSGDRCVELSNSTPIESDLAACLEEATDLEGNVHKGILEIQLMNVAFARSLLGRGKK